MPPTPPIEDRGRPVSIWHSSSRTSFEPFAAATIRHTVSVPIGWRAELLLGSGTHLVHTFPNRGELDAWDTLCLAFDGNEGFRWLGKVSLPELPVFERSVK